MFFDSMAPVIGRWHWSSLPCSPPPRSWPPRAQMETVLLGAFFFQELQERLPSVTHILDQQLLLGNTRFAHTEKGDEEGGSPREANNVAYFVIRGHHGALQQLQTCARSQRSSEGLVVQLMLRVLHATRAFGKAQRFVPRTRLRVCLLQPCTR